MRRRLLGVEALESICFPTDATAEGRLDLISSRRTGWEMLERPLGFRFRTEGRLDLGYRDRCLERAHQRAWVTEQLSLSFRRLRVWLRKWRRWTRVSETNRQRREGHNERGEPRIQAWPGGMRCAHAGATIRAEGAVRDVKSRCYDNLDSSKDFQECGVILSTCDRHTSLLRNNEFVSDCFSLGFARLSEDDLRRSCVLSHFIW
jgi:hypothetical protein